MAETIEIVRFRSKPQVKREEFLARNKEVEQNVIMKMPGIISRETAESGDGEWLVLLHWKSPEDAQNSMDKFVANPATQSFRDILDMNSFNMTRYAKA